MKHFSIGDIVTIKPNFSKKEKIFLIGSRKVADDKLRSAVIVRINEADNYNLRLSDNSVACSVSSSRFLEEEGSDHELLLEAVEERPILFNGFGHSISTCICDGNNKCGDVM